jgi:hypothetical protein
VINDLGLISDNVCKTLGVCRDLAKVDVFGHNGDVLNGYV